MTTAILPTAGAGAPASPLLPVYRQPPIEIVRGEGIHLFDAEGRAYLDFTSGIAVNALGHGDARLLDAIRAAADAGLLHTSNLFHTAPARRLAEALVERSFASSVFLCNSGAEANEGAFKFARRWARAAHGEHRADIVALRGAFHGRLFASLAATDRPGYRAPFRPLAGGITIAERDAGRIARILEEGTTAALILEPVQGEGGVRVLDAGLVRELRALTREHGVALVFDEIQCGLGRTGTLVAYERLGVEPDLLTLAKPLAGGLPMGAVLLAGHVAAEIRPGDHGTTFGGGPLVSAVALHVVERLADPALLAAVRENGAWLGERLGVLASRSPRLRAVRGIGYMWGIDLATPAAPLVGELLAAGLLVCSAGDYTLRLLPPLVATREELARGLAILEDHVS